jgi:hypothetical protein
LLRKLKRPGLLPRLRILPKLRPVGGSHDAIRPDQIIGVRAVLAVADQRAVVQKPMGSLLISL